MTGSLDRYYVFYQVARCKNITQAAAALYSSQPNVTHAVKELERQLGCTLFVRTNKGVQLTPEGALLYAHVLPAVEHLHRAEEELKLQTQLRMGSISIGASEVALRCLLLPILRQFRLEYPDIQVRVSNFSTPQAVSALEDGLVDLAVVTTPALCRRTSSRPTPRASAPFPWRSPCRSGASACSRSRTGSPVPPPGNLLRCLKASAPPDLYCLKRACREKRQALFDVKNRWP